MQVPFYAVSAGGTCFTALTEAEMKYMYAMQSLGLGCGAIGIVVFIIWGIGFIIHLAIKDKKKSGRQEDDDENR